LTHTVLFAVQLTQPVICDSQQFIIWNYAKMSKPIHWLCGYKAKMAKPNYRPHGTKTHNAEILATWVQSVEVK